MLNKKLFHRLPMGSMFPVVFPSENYIKYRLCNVFVVVCACVCVFAFIIYTFIIKISVCE